MDPVMKAWMFFQWLEDYSDDFKMLENQSYIIGSFTNPEAVQRMLGRGVEKYETSDEDFDRLSQELLDRNRKVDQDKKSKHRRKRRKIQG